ncbi:unnamed protein product [Onchocerca flexuosa]|uniref:Uncharacterized protein n=1 Tax=Onchocerca flexuosa TaxID=387005 RepID=A0A183I3G6_9BILA|nr:unnamed protein product [Onchocerca flexuosa]
MGDTEESIDINGTESNKRKNAVNENPSASPCGSSSSGEIKDDSDGEAEDVVRIAQSDATKNGYIEYRRREPERDFYDSRERDVPQQFDPNNDYRHPHLSPEQICLRVRKIPSPDVLVELNDIGLRHLLSDVHELDREQIRLYNNRRRLLEFVFGFEAIFLSLYMRFKESFRRPKKI